MEKRAAAKSAGIASGIARQTPELTAAKSASIAFYAAGHGLGYISRNLFGKWQGNQIRRWLIAAGVYQSSRKNIRRDPTHRRTITEQAAHNALRRALRDDWQHVSQWDDTRYWQRHYKRTPMNNYYTNIEASRERGRMAAKKQYANQSEHLKLKRLLSARIYKAVKRAGENKKAFSTMKLIGCTIDQLKSHLQSTFADGMAWHNYGTWHIDHIKPCTSFDLTNPQEQLSCFHFSNLQALWASDNIRKGDTW